MITVKVELWPGGNESAAREIGRMYVANDGRASSADLAHGDYLVAVCRRGTTDVPREIYGADADGTEPKATRAGEVKHYPRLAYNMWRLITRALLSAFPEEMPTKKLPKGSAPIVDDTVMLGFKMLAELTASGAIPVMLQDPSVRAAVEWLAAAQTSDAAA